MLINQMEIFDFISEPKQVENSFNMLSNQENSKKTKHVSYPKVEQTDIFDFLKVGNEANSEWQLPFNYSEIDDDLRNYLLAYEEKLKNVFENGNPSSRTIIDIRNNFTKYSEYRDFPEKLKQYNFCKQAITHKYCLQLGIEQFNKEYKDSYKYPISKWAKKNIFPIICDYVQHCNDVTEIANYFQENTFYFGTRKDDWGINTAPYPVFKKFLGTEFDHAVMALTSDNNLILKVLEGMGYSNYGSASGEPNVKIIYPKCTPSYQSYLASLTLEDKELIAADKERLKKLHSSL